MGPWDESFLLYSEETEFIFRAADRGWTHVVRAVGSWSITAAANPAPTRGWQRC